MEADAWFHGVTWRGLSRPLGMRIENKRLLVKATGGANR